MPNDANHTPKSKSRRGRKQKNETASSDFTLEDADEVAHELGAKYAAEDAARRREALLDVLEKTSYHDFGREIFPASIRARHVQLHLFDGYWEDIGTIRSFYEANMQLASSNPPFELISPNSPIYCRSCRRGGANAERLIGGAE